MLDGWIVAGCDGRSRDAAVAHRNGTAVVLRGHPWLDGPVGAPQGVGDAWIGQHAVRTGASIREDDQGGLLPDVRRCNGPGFDGARLRPEIRDFYEATARWRLDVWSRWSRWAEPGGRLIEAVFARRLRQLALPLDPLDTAYGLTSRVLTFTDPSGEHLGTACNEPFARPARRCSGASTASCRCPVRPARRCGWSSRFPTAASPCSSVPMSPQQVIYD